MQSNQRLILSQGGRHGRHAKTYLPGQDMSRQASKLVPNRYLSGNSENEFRTSSQNATNKIEKEKKLPEPEAPKVVKAPPAPPAPPAKAEGDAPTPPPAPPTPPEGLAEGENSETPQETEFQLPTSRSQIQAMRKPELIELAAHRGLDTEGKGVTDLRSMLKEDIFGED